MQGPTEPSCHNNELSPLGQRSGLRLQLVIARKYFDTKTTLISSVHHNLSTICATILLHCSLDMNSLLSRALEMAMV